MAVGTSAKTAAKTAVKKTATTKATPAKKRTPAKKAGDSGSGSGGKAGKAVVGKPAPELTFLLEDESETTLAELVKARGVVIFMYPRANTPGCTKQACGFRDLKQKFEKAGFDIYGLSYDNPGPQKRWQEKYDLGFSLLTDVNKEAIKAFGASKEQTKIKRSHIIIAKGGTVLDIKNQVSPGESFEGALEFVEGL